MSLPILKLDETTVNRIAAGEVVQRPAAAVKEMMENSLDAGATSITVTIKGGGLQLLQIQDNGHGIRKEDMGIVCERFTTSKLRTFDDLKKIDTFGFRGEALASITHVAHVTITTKTADAQCAYKGKYSYGKLVPLKDGGKVEPQPCAGMVGTTIAVEDLFYNMSTRKMAFKNTNEQYQRVMDVVGKYSIHYGDQGVAFTCKKQGQNAADVHTPAHSATKENIKLVYGSSVYRELIEFQFSMNEQPQQQQQADAGGGGGGGLDDIDNSCKNPSVVETGPPAVEVKGYITNANYSAKKGVCIIFINHRLVDCSAIKRVVDNVYSDLLPKHSHPFVYLDITMPAAHVDVNVHPTKKEVHFLYEAELLEWLYAEVGAKLKSANESRTFYTQMQLSSGVFAPNAANDAALPGEIESWTGNDKTSSSSSSGSSGSSSSSTGESGAREGNAGAGGAAGTLHESGSIEEDVMCVGGGSLEKERRGTPPLERSSKGTKRPSAASSAAPSKLVRMDPTLRKIDSMLPRLSTVTSSTMQQQQQKPNEDSSRIAAFANGDADEYGGGTSLPAYLLCGTCGSSSAPDHMTLLGDDGIGGKGVDGATGLRESQTSCECCGSADMTVRVQPSDEDFSPDKGGVGTAAGGWESRMATFEETRVGYVYCSIVLPFFSSLLCLFLNLSPLFCIL
jgi:DNA mismatch repair protein MutL